MNKHTRFAMSQALPATVLAATLLCACSPAEPVAAAKAYSDLESEVAAWYRDNFETPIVNKQPFVESVSELYAPPLHYLDLGEEFVLDDEEKVGEFIQGFSDWRDAAPDSTAEVSRIQVEILNDSGAILVADWRFNDRDGQPLGESDPVQYFYLLSKQEGGWRVVGEATVAGGARIRL